MSRAHKCEYDADGICRICAQMMPLEESNTESRLEEMLQVAKWEGRVLFVIGMLVGAGITLLIFR